MNHSIPGTSDISKHLSVSGTVQGVGFRPFVYRLATSLGLTGTVFNTGEGVTIHVEGHREAVDCFCGQLEEKPPPLSHITDLTSASAPAAGYSEFTIDASNGRTGKSTFISPDVGVCDDCLKELRDPGDRRYRYPFINCTHCGPRYTIIEDLPYDRSSTMMKAFAMCPACRAEYDDPAGRRFHAQPIACPACGPVVSLWDAQRRPIPCPDPIQNATDLIMSGNIIAVKGLGGYHLVVDALNREAVGKLRVRKQRPDKPLAVMSPSMEAVSRFAVASSDEAKLLQSSSRPIVLLRKKSPFPLSNGVAPGNRRVGVMLPYTPLHYLLTKEAVALVMTSGNMGGSPVEKDTEQAFASLSHVADYFLVHDRTIFQRCDDSLVHHSEGACRTVRRARGFAPAPIKLKNPLPPVLAVGGELKNTLCFTRNRHAILSQHIGDMVNADTFRFFQETVSHMEKVLGVFPERVAHDMHPDFETTRYANNLPGSEKIAVQHHHAHVAACMAEHRLSGPVVGLALDGNGYGPDGAAWGGEVLVAETTRFHRAGHLGYVPMPGGDAAVLEPWRMALSYLHQAFGSDFQRLNLPMLSMLDAEAVGITMKMMTRRVNSPFTSSSGRLFDGVAAITGLRQHVTYEGQAAMELESLAGIALPVNGNRYPYSVIRNSDGTYQVDLPPLIQALTADVISGTTPQAVSRRFHSTVIALFTDLCDTVSRETGIPDIVLSGGVFQNALVLSGISRALSARGLNVYSHRLVPANDGGLCLGQALVAGSSR